VDDVLAQLKQQLQVEEACEYAEKLALAAGRRRRVPQPISRVRDLALRTEQLATAAATAAAAGGAASASTNTNDDNGSSGAATADDDNAHVQRILADTFNSSGAVVAASAFLLSEGVAATASVYDLQCNYKSHQYSHWTVLLARVAGMGLSPARGVWELLRLPWRLLFWSPPSVVDADADADDADDAAACTDSSGVGSVACAVASSTRWVANVAWHSSSLLWLRDLVAPAQDKRHKRPEAEMLRQFVRTAEREGGEARRLLTRQEEMAALDTTAPDALLFLLGDDCFELQLHEYK
jgi:hypothetical protein